MQDLLLCDMQTASLKDLNQHWLHVYKLPTQYPYLVKYIFAVYNMYSSVFQFLKNTFREIYLVHIHVLV
jgi:hypothetical protein